MPGRWELELAQIREDEDVSQRQLRTVELLLFSANHSHGEHMEVLEKQRKLFGMLRWRNLNKVSLTVSIQLKQLLDGA